MKQKTKIFLVAIVLILIFSMSVVLKTQAGTGDSGMGWLWDGSDDCDIDQNGFEDVICGGDNISTPINTHPVADGISNGNETNFGWVSINNLNCDIDKNGFVDGMACGGDNTTTTSVNYGVNIPSSDGLLSGYAWSENNGWVSFDSSATVGCPIGVCEAKRVGNALQGWARIISIVQAASSGNSGGWQGWIRLSGIAQDGSPYGISINPVDGKMTGYGWSDELGWIDFSRAFIDATPSIPSCTNSVSDVNALLCSNQPNETTGLTVDTPFHLVSSCSVSNVNDSDKCEYYCKAGYQKVGGACVFCENICDLPPTCNSSNCGDSILPNCTNTCTGLPCVPNGCANITCPACPEPSGNWQEVAP